LEIAKTLEDDTLQPAIYGNLGLAHATLENYVKAVRFHKKVMDASMELEDRQIRLQAQINLADAYLQDKRPQQALGFALVAHDLAKELNSKTSLVMILDLLGTIYSRQKDLRTAIDCHRQAAELAVEVGDPHRQAIALANKALAHEALTETEDAYQAMQEAQSLFQMLNSEYAAKTQKDLTRIRKAMGKNN
ncbi:MAG: tetratricopeptide repeat protein, partial [Chloroflexota bacterium]|nr:tetratricopeptide repeat protein [Chloroflexota bacterium]